MGKVMNEEDTSRLEKKKTKRVEKTREERDDQAQVSKNPCSTW